MKIAFVVHIAYPEFIGGREHHIHHLACALSETDEVTVFAGSKKRSVERCRIDGYTLVRIPTISIKVSKNPLQIYRIAPKLYSVFKKEKFDLVHAFEYGSYSTNIAYMYSKRHNIPLVLTVYGYQFRNPFLKLSKRLYDFFFGKSLFKKAEKIFYTSDVQRQEIFKIVRDENINDKVILQENCIPTRDYENVIIKEELLEKYNLGNEIKLLTVGRILPRKGIKYLVFALDRVIRQYHFKDIKLIIVGPDCGELKNIKNTIKRLRLENNVLIVGPVPYHQVKDFLAVSDIFVLPSLYEGLPLALLEAMASGKAVIFSGLPCAQKIIINEKDGILINPADVDSLTNAILRLSKDSRLREYLGLNAKRKVAEFDSQIEARKTRSIYEEIVNYATKE